MHTTRRNWLKTTAWLTAGVCISNLESIAAPLKPFNPDNIDQLPIRLSSNENPYGPSPMARLAMKETIDKSNRYQWAMIRELRSAIALKNNLVADNILVGAGSTQMIDAVIQLASVQKGSFVIAEPSFTRWKPAAESAGLRKIVVPLSSDKKNDLPAMLMAITTDTRLVYICNPNNPTATVCPHDALVSFIKEASAKTLVMVDEAYLDYSDERSVAGMVQDNENLIVVKTFSKIYGMAGARIGYALAHTKTIDRLDTLQSGSNIGIGAMSLAGALAALKDTGFVKESFLLNKKAREYTIQQLERLEISCIPSSTNFVYFSLAKYRGDFFEKLKAHSVEGTGIFEDEGKWSRITVGTMQEMQHFINAIS